jgi:hypothetical protein
MGLELFIVMLIIAGAAGYVVNTVRKQVSAARSKKRSCGGDCGCDR